MLRGPNGILSEDLSLWSSHTRKPLLFAFTANPHALSALRHSIAWSQFNPMHWVLSDTAWPGHSLTLFNDHILHCFNTRLLATTFPIVTERTPGWLWLPSYVHTCLNVVYLCVVLNWSYGIWAAVWLWFHYNLKYLPMTVFLTWVSFGDAY